MPSIRGARMGIAAANTLSYGNDREETIAAFRATASNTGLYATGMMASMAYSEEQRARAGEGRAKDGGGHGLSAGFGAPRGAAFPGSALPGGGPAAIDPFDFGRIGWGTHDGSLHGGLHPAVVPAPITPAPVDPAMVAIGGYVLPRSSAGRAASWSDIVKAGGR